MTLSSMARFQMPSTRAGSVWATLSSAAGRPARSSAYQNGGCTPVESASCPAREAMATMRASQPVLLAR